MNENVLTHFFKTLNMPSSEEKEESPGRPISKVTCPGAPTKGSVLLDDSWETVRTLKYPVVRPNKRRNTVRKTVITKNGVHYLRRTKANGQTLRVSEIGSNPPSLSQLREISQTTGQVSSSGIAPMHSQWSNSYIPSPPSSEESSESGSSTSTSSSNRSQMTDESTLSVTL